MLEHRLDRRVARPRRSRQFRASHLAGEMQRLEDQLQRPGRTTTRFARGSAARAVTSLIQRTEFGCGRSVTLMVGALSETCCGVPTPGGSSQSPPGSGLRSSTSWHRFCQAYQADRVERHGFTKARSRRRHARSMRVEHRPQRVPRCRRSRRRIHGTIRVRQPKAGRTPVTPRCGPSRR